MTPEPSLPKFKYVLQLPWVYGEAYPKNASDILASRSWQEIYRFMQQANQILSASVLFFNYFDRINDISRLKQFATWERLVKLPLELQEEIAHGKLWHMADYMQVLRQDQAKLIRLVERNLGHHRSLTQRPGKVPAQDCPTNLLP